MTDKVAWKAGNGGSDMNEANSALSYKLQLDDIELLIAGEDSTSPIAAPPSTLEVSLFIQKRELQDALSLITDRQMAKSITKAVVEDVSVSATDLGASLLSELTDILLRPML